MKKILKVLFSATILFAISGCSSNDNDLLVGTWEQSDEYMNPIIVEFKDDGTCTYKQMYYDFSDYRTGDETPIGDFLKTTEYECTYEYHKDKDLSFTFVDDTKENITYSDAKLIGTTYIRFDDITISAFVKQD